MLTSKSFRISTSAETEGSRISGLALEGQTEGVASLAAG